MVRINATNTTNLTNDLPEPAVQAPHMRSEIVKFTSRGGFLCDEMGMGKTLVCISLIVSNPCTDAFDGESEFRTTQAPSHAS